MNWQKNRPALEQEEALMLCALQIMIEKLNEVHQEAYIIFIDYSKAFDSVEHEKLFQTLIEMGFPTHLVALIQSLYTDQEIKIRWNNNHTENFRIGARVGQGCILSPHIFSTYTEQILREATTENFGIKVGGRKISNLRYADDTALLAKDHADATTLINQLNNAGEAKGLKLNAKETKYIRIGEDQGEPILIKNEEIEKVPHFNCSMDICCRIAMAKNRMTSLSNIWKDKSISENLKIKLFKTLVWTVMTYGSEGWTLKRKDIKRINAV